MSPLPLTPSTRVEFRAGELESELSPRTGEDSSLGLTAKRDLERYYEILRRDLPSLATNEWCYLLDLLNGHLARPDDMHLLRYVVLEEGEYGLGEKWGVDPEALAEKLRGLPYSSYVGIHDVAERYWQAVARGDAPEPAEFVSALTERRR